MEVESDSSAAVVVVDVDSNSGSNWPSSTWIQLLPVPIAFLVVSSWTSSIVYCYYCNCKQAIDIGIDSD